MMIGEDENDIRLLSALDSFLPKVLFGSDQLGGREEASLRYIDDDRIDLFPVQMFLDLVHEEEEEG